MEIIIIGIIIIAIIYYYFSSSRNNKVSMNKTESMGNLSGLFNNQNQNQNQIINCADVTMQSCNNQDFPMRNYCPTECQVDTNSIAQCREWAFKDGDECKVNPG
jgi:hypothetical protein